MDAAVPARLDAVRSAGTTMRFRPARVRGEPVAVWVTLPVTFALQD